MKNVKTTLAAIALASAATGAIALGAGPAAADTAGVPDGSYTVDVLNPVVPLGAPAVASLPATVDDGTLTIAGQSGRLTPTADGARTTIAGQAVTLYGEDGTYAVEVGGSTWAQLHAK